MTKDRKTRLDQAGEDLTLRLDGLLGQLGTALSEALTRLEEQGDVHHEATIDGPRGPIRASTGIRIRTLGASVPGGTARRPDRPVNAARRGEGDTSGTAAPARDPAPPVRPITATILTEGRDWRLIAELPGVAADDVALTEDAGALLIRAETGARRFEGRFALPDGARAEDLSRQMRNGILELAWERPE